MAYHADISFAGRDCGDTNKSQASERRAAVLILSLSNWHGPARLVKALKRANFDVAALCLPATYLTQTRYLDRCFTIPTTFAWRVLKRAHRVIKSAAPRLVARHNGAAKKALGATTGHVPTALLVKALMRSFEEFRPEFVVAVDETSRQLLNRIRLASAARELPLPRSMLDVIARSLGDAAHLEASVRKTTLVDICHAIGVAAPEQQVVVCSDDAFHFAENASYPIVLKADFGSSGERVRICNSREDVSPALDEIRRILPDRSGPANLNGSHDIQLELADSGKIVAQRFVNGALCGYEAVALNGKLLAGFAMEKIQLDPPVTGASTVVRLFHHNAIRGACDAVIAHLGFTGFVNFDFVVEQNSGNPVFIEMNPRPGPAAHLGDSVGADLCETLHRALYDETAPQSFHPDADRLVALFPREWHRDPNSKWLTVAHHDVPWDDPQLLDAALRGDE